MVDPKNTNETVETAGLDQVARRVWLKPRLETIAVAETENTPTHTNNDGPGTSAS
jgi:hypothetical protein